MRLSLWEGSYIYPFWFIAFKSAVRLCFAVVKVKSLGLRKINERMLNLCSRKGLMIWSWSSAAGLRATSLEKTVETQKAGERSRQRCSWTDGICEFEQALKLVMDETWHATVRLNDWTDHWLCIHLVSEILHQMTCRLSKASSEWTAGSSISKLSIMPQIGFTGGAGSRSVSPYWHWGRIELFALWAITGECCLFKMTDASSQLLHPDQLPSPRPSLSWWAYFNRKQWKE